MKNQDAKKKLADGNYPQNSKQDMSRPSVREMQINHQINHMDSTKSDDPVLQVQKDRQVLF